MADGIKLMMFDLGVWCGNLSLYLINLNDFLSENRLDMLIFEISSGDISICV